MNLYVFFRAEGFYPLELESDASAKSNAAINPGTLKVVRMFPLPEVTLWAVSHHEGGGGGGVLVCDDKAEPRSAARSQTVRAGDFMKIHKPIPRRSMHALGRARWGAPYEDDGNCEMCNASGPTWEAEEPITWNRIPLCAACIEAAERSNAESSDSRP